ncbi:MAG TPA: FAD-dependent oxidoreductase [Gemmataceae bacterium]|nr:FAD-dependent oxidoreductase [Gemmataceae bacterium]
MNRNVVIVGAGMGGLAAALRLARHGYRVTALEARLTAGGLAAGFERDGFTFDAGPYILLDRPGLEWAFRAVGLDPDRLLALRRLDPVYEVTSADGVVRFCADAGQTAAGLDATWPGSGERYLRFIDRLGRVYRRLQPLQQVSRPGLLALLRTGGWRHAPFLLRSLASVLESSGLPRPVVEAMSIWTHVAGQRVEEAPSPLALVCAVIHTVGAFYPVGGLGTVPRVLADAVAAAGVEVRYGTQVRAIGCEGGRVSGVETDRGESLPAAAVVSNHSGVGTYLDLVSETPAPERERLKALPLQSPGVCAYLAITGDPRPPYLRFFLPGGGQLCRLLIRPAVMDPGVVRDGWQPARLLAPMAYADAERGPDAQRAYLERVLAEGWWREGIAEHRVVATRIPAEWGAEYHLYRDSMNPVMTARFMRAGRLAHRSPCVPGLYLAGSSTHPGQWVSFCAVSGVLAADRVREDLA